MIILKQKFDPFEIPDETHCGDCNKLLSKGDQRIEDVHIEHGIRCDDCHVYIEHKIIVAKSVRITSCFQCHHFCELDRREGKGYCGNPDNKNVGKGVRKIVMNPAWEGAKDRTYPLVYKRIPKWCKLPDYVGL